MIADMSGSCSAYTLKASATVLDSVYRVLQCVCASCDWLLTSVEALPHREVTLALSSSLPMYACQSVVPGQVTGEPTAVEELARIREEASKGSSGEAVRKCLWPYL